METNSDFICLPHWKMTLEAYPIENAPDGRMRYGIDEYSFLIKWPMPSPDWPRYVISCYGGHVTGLICVRLLPARIYDFKQGSLPHWMVLPDTSYGVFVNSSTTDMLCQRRAT